VCEELLIFKESQVHIGVTFFEIATQNYQ